LNVSASRITSSAAPVGASISVSRKASRRKAGRGRDAASPSVRSPSRRSSGLALRRLESGARQLGDEALAPRDPVRRGAGGVGLDLHARHVDAGRAFAPARLARDAELQRLGDIVAEQTIGPELAGEREAQRVGAAAREVLFVARDAVGRAHRAGVELPAGAVVVAHLDGTEQAALRAGPRRPVERRRHVERRIVWRVTKQRAVVEVGRADDAAGVEQARGVERVLHRLEGPREAGAEHRFVELAAGDAVAVLAAVAALVGADEVEALFRNGAHRLHVGGALHVEHGPHVQAADGSVRIVGRARAVPLEDGVEALGVVGEIVEVDGAVLDEGDRLAGALLRHHDVEPGLAHLGDVGLEARIDRAHHGAGMADVAHQLVEPVEVLDQRVAVFIAAVELDEQQAFGLAQQHALDRRAVDVDAAAEVDHGAVDELDGLGIERHEVERRLHRGAEARELADADDLPRLDRRELQQQPLGDRQRALGADEQAREVVAARGLRVRRQRVDVVAADAAKLARKARRDLVGLAPAERTQRRDEGRGLLRRVRGAEAMAGAVGEQRVDREHVVGHQTVADALRAAGIIAGHAADRAALVRRGVDGEEQAVRLQRRVEVAEHEAGLDQRRTRRDVDLDEAAQVLRAVEHDRAVDGLAALARAAAARQDRDAEVAGDGQRRLQVVAGLRHDDAERLDLVDRGVGRKAAAVGAPEENLALHLASQRVGERGIAGGNADGFGPGHGRGVTPRPV
jgi:hypothetical protein